MNRIRLTHAFLLLAALLAACKGNSEKTPEEQQADREKAAAAMAAIPLGQRRGFEQTGDGSREITIIKAPLAAVTDALLKGDAGKIVVTDALGKQVQVMDQSYLLMQLKGHAWTTIVRMTEHAMPISDLAKSLSRDLKTEAIVYTYNDFSSKTTYQLLDNGDQIESLVDTENGLKFDSSRRQMTDAEKKNVDLYLDRALKAEDAYIPEIGGVDIPVGNTTIPPDLGYKTEDLQGTVFVAGKGG